MSDVSLTITEATPINLTFDVGMPGADGQGVPVGGTLGQVLTKLSATDYDTEWAAPGATSNYETYPAGENLSAGRVVVIDGGEAFYFDPTDATHHNRAFGVTRTSATAGYDVTIQPAYTVATDAAFTFAADIPLWVGSSGEVVNAIDLAWAVIQKSGRKP